MKSSTIYPRILVITFIFLLCLGFSPEQLRVVAFPAREVRSGPNEQVIKRAPVVPIGPVTELPGSTLSRTYNPPDLSYIGKGAALEITIGGIQLDKYTSVWWGPQDLTAVKHSLSGGMAPDRVMTFDPASSNLAGGSGYWLGSSPSSYPGGTLDTRFRLLTLNPMILSADVNISDADVVLPITGGGLSAQIQFQTWNGSSFVPSNDYFNSFSYKSSSLSGSILSSYSDAFWYTAPDVEVASQSFLSTYCLGSYASIEVSAANHGPGPATQINVDIVLPAEWEFVSYGSSPCGVPECYNPSTGQWTVGDLPEGNASMLSLTVKLTLPGEVFMTATKTQYQVDSVTANDIYMQTLTTNYCSFMPNIIR